MTTGDVIKDIRVKLRRSMNGAAAASMRGMGIEYKFNFGVSLPGIKEIAGSYGKDAELAEALWKEDVRELKILATLLYPPSVLKPEDALRWVARVRHQEIAEQLCRNLLQETPFAEELAMRWLSGEGEFTRVVGFLLFSRLCAKDAAIPRDASRMALVQARKELDKGSSRPQRAAVIALKKYGCRGEECKREVLELVKDYGASESAEKQEFFNDIKFELDYRH